MKQGSAGTRLIILDRDGVINQDSDDFIRSPDAWQPVPGSLPAIARLTQAGWRVVVASNQSGVGRGYFDMDTLNRIHERMHKRVQEAGGNIEAVFACTAVDDENPYRKPNPGMLNAIADRLGLSLIGVPVVGDAARDVEAARRAGAWPILVRTGKGERALAAGAIAPDVAVFDDLAAVVDHLLSAESGAAA